MRQEVSYKVQQRVSEDRGFALYFIYLSIEIPCDHTLPNLFSGNSRRLAQCENNLRRALLLRKIRFGKINRNGPCSVFCNDTETVLSLL
jgi:hypothetical protein